jgi:hypothetical protein
MSLMKLLRGIGDRLGILETVSAPDSPATARIRTRSVSLRELTGEIQSGAVESLAKSPSELEVPFEKIFESAGITANSQHWTADRLKLVIEGEHFGDKPREEVQKAVLERLRSEGIAAEVIVKDAMMRDRAMDAYEVAAREKMLARTESCKTRLAAAESRIRELQEECRAMEEAMKNDEARWSAWKKHKRAKERELASILSYIVDHQVITSDEQDT